MLQFKHQYYLGFIALMMEAARTSETLLNFYQTARRYNPEDSHHRYYPFIHAWISLVVYYFKIVELFSHFHPARYTTRPSHPTKFSEENTL
jgi:hypothetical protein